MTDDVKAIVELATVIAAALAAIFNVIALLVGGKTDPSALKVVDNVAKATAANSRHQADRIDKLNKAIVKEMRQVTTAVNTAAAKIDSLTGASK